MGAEARLNVMAVTGRQSVALMIPEDRCPGVRGLQMAHHVPADERRRFGNGRFIRVRRRH